MKSLYEIFDDFTHVPGAPRQLDDLPAFEKQCREEGRLELADFLEAWRQELQYHIEKEHEKVIYDAPAPQMCKYCNHPHPFHLLGCRGLG